MIRTFIAGVGRRARVGSLVVARSAEYAVRNRGALGWRDLALLPAAVAVYLAIALVAPDALAEESILDGGPHAPVDVS